MDFSLCGGTQVMGFISPFNTNDTYAVVDPIYGIDGLRNVANLTELNLIPNERRRTGMVVGVSNGDSFYKLNPPPWSGTTDDWSDFITFKYIINNNTNNLYTISNSDFSGSNVIRMSSTTANTILIPDDATLTLVENGNNITITQTGSGQTTISGGTGVTIQSTDSATKLRTQHSSATIIKVDTDTWLLNGDITI